MHLPFRSRAQRSLALTGIGALAVLGLSACVPPPGGGNGTVTETFDCTGDTQTWTVPSGVFAAEFDLLGAEGGPGAGDSAGGLGGHATVSSLVAPTVELEIEVGCAGGETEGTPGYNGGGAAGSGLLGNGGTGGGASDVRSLGVDGTTFVPFVAAGGGGGGGCSNLGSGVGGAGGEGGGDPGGDGGDAAVLAGLIGGGGGGGSTTSGGSGGLLDGLLPLLGGGDGSSLIGGTGGASGGGLLLVCGGGGGGGGVFGGGGGGAGVVGAGGGGGGAGGGIDGTELESGVREGDGQVSITYTPIG